MIKKQLLNTILFIKQQIINVNGASQYLVFDSTDKHKEVFKKYTELWGRIKNEIETINGGKKFEYDKNFMKIKFDSDDNLPLNKPLKFPTMKIIVGSVFEEGGKFYPKIYLDECLYES